MTEIVSKIKAKSELDCKARDIVTIEDGDGDCSAALEKFLRILKDDTGSKEIRGLFQALVSFVELNSFVIVQSVCGVPLCLGALFINEIAKHVPSPVSYYWITCVIASWFTCVDSIGACEW